VLAQGQLQPQSRDELIAALRPDSLLASDAARALADWLEAN
jgi:hypothetical protein